MRIDSNYPNATTGAAHEQRAQSTRHGTDPQNGIDTGQIQGGPAARLSATAAASRMTRPSDTAEISGVVRSISDLAAAVHTASDVRDTKVQALREAVDQGTYRVSPERIAESMLAQATSKLR